MKKIITENPSTIDINRLTGRELVAYRSHNSENYCILTKLVQVNTQLIKDVGDRHDRIPGTKYRYGFVALNTSDSSPRFVGNDWLEAVRIAGASRELYTFNTMKELIEAMYLTKF